MRLDITTLGDLIGAAQEGGGVGDWEDAVRAALKTLVEYAPAAPTAPPAPDTSQQEGVLIQGLNCAFLLTIFTKSPPAKLITTLYARVSRLGGADWKARVRFYRDAAPLVRSELGSAIRAYNAQQKDASEDPAISTERTTDNRLDAVRQLYKFFFPEGAGLLSEEAANEQAATLRARRTISVIQPNPHPITDPAAEVLFTSNVLLTVPDLPAEPAAAPDSASPKASQASQAPQGMLRYPKQLRERLHAVAADPQNHWYDHPIAVGCSSAENELLYGLHGLDEMAEFEKQQGTMGAEQKLSVLLSVSTTHNALRALTSQIIASDLHDKQPLRHLRVWALTESDCRAIFDTILAPVAREMAAANRLPNHRARLRELAEVFGVDGEYGRHYTLLKAIAPLWKLFVDPNLRATFKIDLDQRFPQQTLVDETGQSALQHFTTPLWGALARDHHGTAIHLGMLAGALVNEKDIASGVFTPDVTYNYADLPASLAGGRLIFDTRLPQAVSTIAEHAARDPRAPIHRIHVTGGTNGILIDALRRYRPFTPAECGRAEDQAYLLSVLHAPTPALRYLHCPGLRMRHDKSAFAATAIKRSATATTVGDYLRMLFFSHYAAALPRGIDAVKQIIDPFTGAFVTPIPLALGCLRAALEIAAAPSPQYAGELLDNIAARLPAAHRQFAPRRFAQSIAVQRRAWNLYYDILDYAELHLRLDTASPAMTAIRTRARKLLTAMQVKI